MSSTCTRTPQKSFPVVVDGSASPREVRKSIAPHAQNRAFRVCQKVEELNDQLSRPMGQKIDRVFVSSWESPQALRDLLGDLRERGIPCVVLTADPEGFPADLVRDSQTALVDAGKAGADAHELIGSLVTGDDAA